MTHKYTYELKDTEVTIREEGYSGSISFGVGGPSAGLIVGRLMDEVNTLREALQGLLFPNVISADDLRVLIIMTSDSQSKIDKAMPMADKLEAAQEKGRAALGLKK